MGVIIYYNNIIVLLYATFILKSVPPRHNTVLHALIMCHPAIVNVFMGTLNGVPFVSKLHFSRDLVNNALYIK